MLFRKWMETPAAPLFSSCHIFDCYSGMQNASPQPEVAVSGYVKHNTDHPYSTV